MFALDDAEADRLSLERVYARLDPGGRLVSAATSAQLYAELGSIEHGPSMDIPAYLLLDVNLPDRDGLDVLSDLRDAYPALPVVMLSGSARPIDKHRAYTSGASGFVSKPLGLVALTQAISIVDEYWQRVVSPPDRIGI